MTLLNIFRADIYKIKKSLSFFLLLAFIFLITISWSVFAIISNDTSIREMPHNLRNMVPIFKSPVITSSVSFFANIFVIYFLTKDFTSRFIVNIVSRGVSKNDYFASKLLSVFSAIFTFYLASLLIRIISCGLFSKTESFNLENFIFIFFEIIYHISWTSFAIFLVMLFKTPALSLTFFLTANFYVMITLGILNRILSATFKTNIDLANFWFGNVIYSNNQQGIIVCLIWTMLTISLAYVKFSKSEIK